MDLKNVASAVVEAAAAVTRKAAAVDTAAAVVVEAAEVVVTAEAVATEAAEAVVTTEIINQSPTDIKNPSFLTGDFFVPEVS